MTNSIFPKVFLFSTFFLIASISFGQKIKFKKDKVLLDGKEIFKFESRKTNGETFVYPLGGGDEIIYIRREDNETPGYYDDDYAFIEFPQLELKLETPDYVSAKRILGWMAENDVIDADGNINEENARKFVKRYDKNITNRTIR